MHKCEEMRMQACERQVQMKRNEERATEIFNMLIDMGWQRLVGSNKL